MKTTKVPAIVFIAVLTAITVLFWVAFSVYRVFTNKPTVNIAPEVLQPFDPTLDVSSIEKIENSIYYEEGRVPEIIVVVPTPTATTSAATPATTSGKTKI